jgi:hypothetical protein
VNECYNGGNGDVYNPSNMTGVDFMGVLIDRSWIGVDWSRQKESDVLGAPPEAFTTATVIMANMDLHFRPLIKSSR